jgi:hypothetical protein
MNAGVPQPLRAFFLGSYYLRAFRDIRLLNSDG